VKRLRRLFAFAFRHEWAVCQERCRITDNEMITTLVCFRCRQWLEYPTLDRAKFIVAHRLRGCPGSPGQETRP